MRGKRSHTQHKGGDKLKKKFKKTLSDTHEQCSESALDTSDACKHKTSKRDKVLNVKTSKDLLKDEITRDKDIVLNQNSTDDTEAVIVTEKRKLKKSKKKHITNDCPIKDSHSKDNVTKSEESKPKILAKNPNPNIKNNNNLRQNKKIIFKDDTDEPEESTTGSESHKRSNKKNNLQEEPKDEEIDQFCDDIDEEDNVEYENWVKLIEAKLSKKSELSKNKT